MHAERPPRTVLEQVIRERRQTFEEFSADAERFATEHRMRATLSARHVQRLASGQRADGTPLGPVRPATRKLLESMLGRPIDDLLDAPQEPPPAPGLTDSESELRARLAAARAVDSTVVDAFQQQMELARVVDRRLGAPGLLAELNDRTAQIQRLLRHALTPAIRTQLAAILVDTSSLAGWLSLDSGAVVSSWDFYNQARTAALESGSEALYAYACGAQSAVLLDIGEPAAAVELTQFARATACGVAPRSLLAWLGGAHGEACAANGQEAESLASFDAAARLISGADASETPYLVFDEVHLSRWRGNALARLGRAEATEHLSRTLGRLDRSFTRAEISLRTDLAEVLIRSGERESAREHTEYASRLALRIGSVRQQRRIARLSLAS